MVVWITGLPGAGKTTIATLLLNKLHAMNKQALLIDGDAIREVLQQKNYDIESRKKLALTYSRLGKLFSEQGIFAICATVSMFDDVRKWNVENIENYFEVFVKASRETLQTRNQKQLYSEALSKSAANVPGINQLVEEPKYPNLIIHNDGEIELEEFISLISEKICRKN